MIDWSKVTDPELAQEVNRRAREDAEKERLRRKALEKSVLENIDVLLLFVPEHTRSSCTDASAVNAHRCTRCSMLHIKNVQYVPPNWSIEVFIR